MAIQAPKLASRDIVELQREIDAFQHFGKLITVAKRHADFACIKNGAHC